MRSASATHDSQSDRMVVFGGYDGIHARRPQRACDS